MMAGFDLEGYEERIPCPHCGSTDCAGVEEDKRGRKYLICIKTHKRISAKALQRSAEAHGLKSNDELLREELKATEGKPVPDYDPTWLRFK